MSEQITSRDELLAAAKAGAKRTHEQTVMAILAITRVKAHPQARMHKAADGTITITIPPKETP